MPSSTFFRLPEEKQRRLIRACWSEVSRVRFSEISISRIIAAAHIPRGSFYQYFEDKEDLVRYLLGDMREYFTTQLRDILVEAKGDLFALPLAAYDRFFNARGSADPMLALFIRILQLNQGIDIQSFISDGGSCGILPDRLWEVVDVSKLRQNGREYADHIFQLACAVLAFAIAEALWDPARSSLMRGTLQTRVDVLRYGGAADSYKEENI